MVKADKMLLEIYVDWEDKLDNDEWYFSNAFDSITRRMTSEDALTIFQMPLERLQVKFTCHCCGYKTLDEEPTDTYEICEICFWEDDGVQFRDPDFEGGPNDVTLRQAQQNYIKFGACQEDCIEFVRKPNKKDIKDPNWKQLLR